jgi:hypothetical protein
LYQLQHHHRYIQNINESNIPSISLCKHSIMTTKYWEEIKMKTNFSSCNLIKITCLLYFGLVGWFMVFNATFNNISVISWQSVLLMEETEVPGENHRLAVSH